MSLKIAVAAVLKAMRKIRRLSQKDLAEVSSRTYVSKLERGQSSPTLEMMATLSAPLGLTPLGLVAVTLAAETGRSIKSLIEDVELEVSQLAKEGAFSELKISFDITQSMERVPSKQLSSTRRPRSLEQTELCFD
ncbi:helix-turn-helix domain-containing protein [Pseudomonas capsici]|uniref:helix-turn-helix domain-containing protein n=1 Tax=Pseudomonas capsici TaxID=2810614 RepID=UPI0021F0DFE4|nr:helix-turn-helix transcriptional regulator [Pseudomonas capsici]MCV4275827.1 helix-turn-helix domain-containing protein [Pseudomonas capsici]